MVFLFFEIFIAPEFRLAERGISSIAGIEYDVVHEGLEIRVAKVARGGLKGIKEEPGFFVVDLAGHGHAHDLHDGDLDGIGVLKNGKIDGAGTARLIGIDANALLVPLLVKETELVAAQSGRTALGTVDFDVLTAIWIRRHE